jgi:hypothetical protein
MEKTYDSIPRNNMKVILGGLNAKIGKENWYRGTIGTENVHEVTNNNGIKLIDFAESKNMIVSSTYFPHKVYIKEHGQHWVGLPSIKFIMSS